MQVLSPDLIKDKKVLLRMDLDVPLKLVGSKRVITEDYRLTTAIPTLHLCLEFAQEVIIMGHLGRPEGVEVSELSVEPIYDWLEERGFGKEIYSGKLQILENLRFEKGEEEASLDYARVLASYGNVFINEAFAAHHAAASTTILPTLMPHAAGLRFTKEVHVLEKSRTSPERPLIAIIGGVKIEDKYEAIVALSKFSDAVLVGGLLPQKMIEQKLAIPNNVVLAKTGENGIDISGQSVQLFKNYISQAKQIVWGGPMGKYEDPEGNKASIELAEAIVSSKIDCIIGGGDTIAALDSYLHHFSFVSTGGGAMLELLSKGTLPTIEALK